MALCTVFGEKNEALASFKIDCRPRMHLLGQEAVVEEEEAVLAAWDAGGCARGDCPPRRNRRARYDHRHSLLGGKENTQQVRFTFSPGHHSSWQFCKKNPLFRYGFLN